MRPSGRNNDQLRNVKVTHNFTKHAEGSVLIEFGDTKVLCTASVMAGVPRFKKDSGEGWLTALSMVCFHAQHILEWTEKQLAVSNLVELKKFNV